MHARQEVLNSALAHLLEEQGLVALPEQRTTHGKLPDVLLALGGLPMMLEAEVDDQPHAAEKAYHKARERLEQGLCYLALALVYPAKLRMLSPSQLQHALRTTPLRFALLRPPLPEQPDWRTGDLNALADTLRHAYQLLVAEDEVRRAVEQLKQGIEILARAFYAMQVHEARLAEPLGISPRAIDPNRNEQTTAVRHIAALVLLNALLFHEELARTEPRVPTLNACFEGKEIPRSARNDRGDWHDSGSHPQNPLSFRAEGEIPRSARNDRGDWHNSGSQPQNPLSFRAEGEESPLSPHDALLKVWKSILDEINYHAVFDLARRILINLPPHFLLDDALRQCLPIVRELIRQRTLLRHDLAGRVYHLLLGDIAKPLGTYYTSVASATLLLRLALAPERWALDWSHPDAVGQFRLADLACGTGTLLMAAMQAIVDNYLRLAPPDPNARIRLLQRLLEEGIWGLDVLQSAVHLTAATLAMPIPEAMVQGMRLYTMPLGIVDGVARLGSLDLLSDAPATPQLSLYPELGQTAQRATDAERQPEALRLPPLDLVCMNPPFTRTCGDNLLFGSLPSAERTRLQKALQELLKAHGAEAHITAGLGAVFIAVADRHLKAGGRLAFVLPKALLSGVAWQPSRELLARAYQMEYVIVSHDPTRWNFSENTDLSETLFVARKLPEPPSQAEGVTLCLNLWRNPDNPVDALLLAHQVRGLAPSGERVEVFDLWMGDEKWGEAIALPTERFNALPHWLLSCAFAQGELVEALLELMGEGRLRGKPLPLCPLSELGELGPDWRRIWATFVAVDNPPGYPAVWGHDTDKVAAISQSPNCHLVRRPDPPEKQAPDYPQRLWAQAGRLLISERLRLNTQRHTAVVTEQPVLATSWWTVRFTAKVPAQVENLLALWLNSTLGVLLLVGNRQETEGAWTKYKKPTLSAMPVLDVRALSKRQVSALARAFERVANQPLSPLSQMDADPVRAQIDEAIADALGLGDLAGLREALCREPVVGLRRLGQRRR
jgi:hypothetical protein